MIKKSLKMQKHIYIFFISLYFSQMVYSLHEMVSPINMYGAMGRVLRSIRKKVQFTLYNCIIGKNEKYIAMTLVVMLTKWLPTLTSIGIDPDTITHETKSNS